MPPKSQPGAGALVVPTNPVPDQLNCAGTSSRAEKSRSSTPAQQLANKPAASMVAVCVSKGQRLEYKLESNGGDATWCRAVVQRTVAKVRCANQLAVWVEMEFDDSLRMRVLLHAGNEGVVWRCAHGPDLESDATRSASSDGILQEQQHQFPNTPFQPTAAAPPISTKCIDVSVARAQNTDGNIRSADIQAPRKQRVSARRWSEAEDQTLLEAARAFGFTAGCRQGEWKPDWTAISTQVSLSLSLSLSFCPSLSLSS